MENVIAYDLRWNMTHLFIRFAHLHGWFPKLVSLASDKQEKSFK